MAHDLQTLAVKTAVAGSVVAALVIASAPLTLPVGENLDSFQAFERAMRSGNSGVSSSAPFIGDARSVVVPDRILLGSVLYRKGFREAVELDSPEMIEFEAALKAFAIEMSLESRKHLQQDRIRETDGRDTHPRTAWSLPKYPEGVQIRERFISLLDERFGPDVGAAFLQFHNSVAFGCYGTGELRILLGPGGSGSYTCSYRKFYPGVGFVMDSSGGSARRRINLVLNVGPVIDASFDDGWEREIIARALEHSAEQEADAKRE